MTSTSLSTTLGDYVLDSDLSTTLGDYVLDSDISTTTAVTSGSSALVTSGGVYTAIDSVADDVADLNNDLSSLGTAALADTTTSVTSGSSSLVTSGAVHTALGSYVLSSNVYGEGDISDDGAITAGLVRSGNTSHLEQYLRKDGYWAVPAVVPSYEATHNDNYLRKDGQFAALPTTSTVSSGSTRLITSGAVHSAISGLSINHVMADAGTFALNNANQDMNDLTRYFTWNNTVNNLTTGIRHVNNQSQGHGSLFNITKKGEFLIMVRLICKDGVASDRSLIYLELRVNNRNLNNQFTTRGPNIKQYYLESSYYRDDITVDDLVLGGTIGLWLEDNQQFEIVARRRYSQDAGDTIKADTALSTLFIERHDYAID